MSSINNIPTKSSDLANEIDKRIYDRNLPSQLLQPYINVRPVMTKYSIMPIVDPRKVIKTPINVCPTYNTNAVFNPGNTQSPWSGFATNINKESELRNQIFALQKCSQSVYVPEPNSDLYVDRNPIVNPNLTQPFQRLFVNEQFNTYNPNYEGIAKNIFNNHTRVQLRVPIKK